MPQKEIGFFSRERYWEHGRQWYENHFAECDPGTVVGEFSTSYLSSAEAPARIHEYYPTIELIMSLRSPVDRAYSSYLNDMTTGLVPRGLSFKEAIRSGRDYLQAGRYDKFLRAYLSLFPNNKVFVSVFEDAREDPSGEMERIYDFLGVDTQFQPNMALRRIGAGRIPRSTGVERFLLKGAAMARSQRHLRRVWWSAKRLGVGDWLRRVNTANDARTYGLAPEERGALLQELEPDIAAVERVLGRELPAWRR